MSSSFAAGAHAPVTEAALPRWMALEEKGHGTRSCGCGSNPTAKVADELRRFVSQRTQCLDGYSDKVVHRCERAALGSLSCFRLRSHRLTLSRLFGLSLTHSLAAPHLFSHIQVFWSLLKLFCFCLFCYSY